MNVGPSERSSCATRSSISCRFIAAAGYFARQGIVQAHQVNRSRGATAPHRSTPPVQRARTLTGLGIAVECAVPRSWWRRSEVGLARPAWGQNPELSELSPMWRGSGRRGRGPGDDLSAERLDQVDHHPPHHGLILPRPGPRDDDAAGVADQVRAHKPRDPSGAGAPRAAQETPLPRLSGALQVPHRLVSISLVLRRPAWIWSVAPGFRPVVAGSWVRARRAAG